MSDKEKYVAYENVRRSGITNMFNISFVSELSGLSKEDVIYVMNHYSELREQYEN